MIKPKKASIKKSGNKPARDNYWKTKQGLEKKQIKLFDQIIFRDWCKACGICMAFCPKQIISKDKEGKPVINNPDACIGCKFCELHCPDFAITIKERYPDRRSKPNGS